MVLPIGEVARLYIGSLDVDHSFWVPDFLFKRDAIPGQITAFDLRAGQAAARTSDTAPSFAASPTRS